MNRSSKTSTIGEWTTPVSKIGLMYASDYTLSLGDTAIAMTTGTHTNRATLKTGWMHQSNNDTSVSTAEWTIARYGQDFVTPSDALSVGSCGYVSSNNAISGYAVRPILYLGSNEKISSGSGEYSDPYILGM